MLSIVGSGTVLEGSRRDIALSVPDYVYKARLFDGAVA